MKSKVINEFLGEFIFYENEVNKTVKVTEKVVFQAVEETVEMLKNYLKVEPTYLIVEELVLGFETMILREEYNIQDVLYEIERHIQIPPTTVDSFNSFGGGYGDYFEGAGAVIAVEWFPNVLFIVTGKQIGRAHV